MATETIDDSLGMVRTVNGIEIHATTGGKFAAIVGGKRLELASLAAVAKRIEGISLPVEGMHVPSNYSGLREAECRTVTRVTKNKQIHYLERDHWDKNVTHERSDSLHGYYVFDQAAHDQLADVARRYADLARERDAIISKLTPITLATWPEIQAERQAQAAEAAASPAE